MRPIACPHLSLCGCFQVVVFYDTQLADPAEVSRALQIAVAASRSVVGYEFYKCDTSSTANRQLADESKLRGGVYIFSRTVDDGIGESLRWRARCESCIRRCCDGSTTAQTGWTKIIG